VQFFQIFGDFACYLTPSNPFMLRPGQKPPLNKKFWGIRIILDLLEHADISTTMIKTHVLGRGRQSVTSPLGSL